MKSMPGQKKPEAYFEMELFPSLKPVFQLLGLTFEESLEMFRTFVEMDRWNSGTIDLANFYRYYGIKGSRFSDRVFTFMDKDGSGKLHFKEFLLGVWNYSTYSSRQIARVAFSFFDVDKKGVIDMADIDALFRMVYNTSESDWDKILAIFGKVGKDDRLDLPLAAFQDKIEADPKLLHPAFELQRIIRRKTFGINYWVKQQERRAVEFKNYDDNAEDTWGGLVTILAEKKKEVEQEIRPAEPSDEPAEVDPFAKYVIPEEEKYLELQQKTLMIVRREKKEFSERRVHSLLANETQDDTNEREAWARLEAAKKVLTDTPFTIDQIEARTAARAELWAAFDNVMEKVRALARTKEEMAIELARGPDADAKCSAYIASASGKKRFDWEVMNHYGKILHDSLHDNAVLQIFSGMFDAPAGQVTWATAAAFKYGRTRRTLEAARKRARESIREEIVERDYKVVKKTYAEKAIATENDFNMMIEQLTADFGSRKSQWEVLWDYAAQSFYYYHMDSHETVYGTEVAICEKCDSHILPEDSRCLTCGAHLSKKNKKLYRGLDLGRD